MPMLSGPTRTNDQQFTQYIMDGLNKGLKEVGEAAIQAALKDIEGKMKEKLAVMVVSLIDCSFSLERFGHELRIVVVHKPTREEKDA